MSVETQCKAILAHLSAGHAITPLEAMTRFQCMRLGARVWELRKAGHAIESQFVATPSGKRIKEYWLARG